MNKHDTFKMALMLLIDANKSVRSKEVLMHLGTAQTNREIKTVQVSAGRNIGKTTCIVSMVDLDRDIVLFPTELQKNIFLERMECEFPKAYSINRFFRLAQTRGINKLSGTIWVDNFSSVKGNDLNDLMNFLDGVALDDDGIIVLVG